MLQSLEQALGYTYKIRCFVLVVCAETHRPSAICTLHKTCKDLCRSVFLLSAAIYNLFLNPPKDILGDKGFMSVFHSEPFFLRLSTFFLFL